MGIENWFPVIKNFSFGIPLNPPLKTITVFQKKSGVQRGTSPEQSWITGCNKSNIEARPPLIAIHELK